MPISDRDPNKMTKEEIQAELDDLNSRGKDFVESIARPLSTILKPVEKVSNVVDYFTGAPVRAAAIEGIKEYKKPESTAAGIAAATLSGPMNSMLRDPTEYDPRYNYAALAGEIGVPKEPIPGTDIPINQGVGLAAEVIADPFTVAGRSFKPLGTMLKEKSLANAEVALTRMSDAGVKRTSEWLDKDKLKAVAITMREEGLNSYINNPAKLKVALRGETTLAPNANVPGKMSQQKVKPGKMDEIGKKIQESISIMEEASSGTINGKPVSSTALNKQSAADLIADAIIEENRTSATTHGPEMDNEIRKKVHNIYNVGVGSPSLTISEAVDLKRQLQDKVYQLKNSESLGHQVGTDKHIYEVAEHAMTEYLNTLAQGKNVPKQAGLDFLKYNQKYSDLSVLNQLLEHAQLNKMQSESGLAGAIIPAAIGGGIGLAAGVDPIVTAGVYGLARGATSSARGSLPATTSKIQGMNIPGLSPQATERMLNYVQKPAAVTRGLMGNPSREPQSVNIPLPMQLVKYQIPRNSEQILANKDIVLAKIAQMSNDQVLVEQFTDAINEHPEKLKKVLPALIMGFPDLFEPDDYNRVDGKILDPMLRQKALKDLSNNKSLSVREKAFKAKRLEMEGVLE